MRIVNGNTRQPSLQLTFVNVDGVMGRHRPFEILDLQSDIIA